MAVAAYTNIHVWEIWNEPQFFPSGYLCCTNNVTLMASHYLDVLAAAYRIIKAHNSSDMVLGLGGSIINVPTDNFSLVFTSDLFSAGAGKYCDGISIHAYSSNFVQLLNETLPRTPPGWGYSKDPTNQQVWASGINFYETTSGEKPIWITEVDLPLNSWNSSGTDRVFYRGTPERQSLFLNQTFTFFNSYSLVKAIFWYGFSGFNSPSSNLYFGIWNATTWTPEPAFYAWENFNAGQVLLYAPTVSRNEFPINELVLILVFISGISIIGFNVYRTKTRSPRFSPEHYGEDNEIEHKIILIYKTLDEIKPKLESLESQLRSVVAASSLKGQNGSSSFQHSEKFPSDDDIDQYDFDHDNTF